ncbi:MAG: hypothetical protein LBB75_04020 [Oscillospiraceae bacterium]|jgi:hypothetical protein|nr:hypothetical protein [Oscillospiraceae bacterium]
MANPKRIVKRILRILAIIVAIPLAIIALLVAVPFAGSIGLKQEPLPADASAILRRAHVGERWMMGAGRILDGLTRMPKGLPDAADFQSENFYTGGESEGGAWQLGYAQAVVTPEDWETRAYYEGGNISIPMRRLNAKLDELKVRVIALSAGEGSVNIFAAVDSIGVTNRQVRQIRAMLADLDLQSVNIAATHVHSAVDTIGFYSKGGDVDEGYLAFVNEKTAGAIRAAVDAMEPGKFYLSQIGSNSLEEYDRRFWEKMGIDWETDEWNDEWEEKYVRTRQEMLAESSIEEYGLGEYIRNRRVQGLYPTHFNKLRFAPDDPESKETLLLNFAAHPFYAGFKNNGWAADSLSGDFVYYMEESLNQAGANMLYINGAQNGLYPVGAGAAEKGWYEDGDVYRADINKTNGWRVRRIGRDFSGIALAMTMPPGDIAASALTDPDNDHGWEYRNIITMMQTGGTVSETELQPQLNIRLNEVRVDIENPVVRWAAKRDMLNMNVLRDGKKLLGSTEIGLLELGGAVTVALLPGECTPGLAWRGIDTTADRAIRQREFAAPTFSESAGRDVLVFGLCNDEIGYIIPDSDYLMFYVPDFLAEPLMGAWDYDHYAELLSPGPGAAGTFARAFEELAKLASN